MTNFPTVSTSVIGTSCKNSVPAKGLGTTLPCLCKIPMASQSSILSAPTGDPVTFLSLNTEQGCGATDRSKPDHQSNCTAIVFTHHGQQLPYSNTEISPLNLPQSICTNPFPKTLDLLAIRVELYKTGRDARGLGRIHRPAPCPSMRECQQTTSSAIVIFCRWLHTNVWRWQLLDSEGRRVQHHYHSFATHRLCLTVSWIWEALTSTKLTHWLDEADALKV